MTLRGALIASTLMAGAFAQRPPCLSDFQSVGPSTPTDLGEVVSWIGVDGDLAVAWYTTIGPGSIRLEVFAQHPSTGQWVAESSFSAPHLIAGVHSSSFVDGRLSVGTLPTPGHVALEVYEYDRVARQWNLEWVTDAVDPYSKVRLARSGIAIGRTDPPRIEIHRRQPDGTYAFEAELRRPRDSSPGFEAEFDFDGELLVSTAAARFDIHRKNQAGMWTLEASLTTSPQTSIADFYEGPILSGGRAFIRARQNQVDGPGVWTIGAFDHRIGLRSGGRLDVGSLRFELGRFGAGTAIVDVDEPACGSIDPTRVPLEVADVGPRDQLVHGGRICQLAGFATIDDIGRIAYDGRTIVASTRGEIGAPPNRIHFATLLGADHDRNRNCVEDIAEIALAPSLDRNSNHVLDSVEDRGEVECHPAVPNSSGDSATMRVLGSAFEGCDDLMAVSTGLPANAFVLLFVGPSEASGPALGNDTICIGGGAMLGRYPVMQAGADGVAVRDLDVLAAPTPFGPMEVLAGVTWGWQFAYRDGAVLRTTPSVRLALD